MDLGQKNKDLTDGLFKASIFYIPQFLFDYDERAKALMLEYRVADIVILVTKDGDIKDIGEDNCSFEVMHKVRILDNNKFQLLELKEQLKDFQYESIIDSYSTQLNFYVYVADWLNQNYKVHNIEITQDQINALQIQSATFKLHQEHVKKYCLQEPKAKYITKEVVVNDFSKEFPSMFKDIKTELIDKKGISANVLQDIKSVGKQKKSRKKILITEKEAEDYLLRTAFNLDNDILKA